MKLKNYLFIIFIFINCHDLLWSQIETDKKASENTNFFENQSSGAKGVAAVPFAIRLPGFPAGNIKVKGDVVLVGNNIINRTNNTLPTFDSSGNVTNLAALTAAANTPYNGNAQNNGFNQEYIDVDTDPTTFSSSTADIAIKNLDGSVNNCKKIVYAGLYWSAFYGYERNTNPSQNGIGTPINNDWNQIKFKVPGGSYQTITADTNSDAIGDEDEIIVREYSTTSPNASYGSPYVCYKNITNIITALADANGTYTVANMRAARGISDISGHCAGWTMVIVFESPTYPSRYITVFDGYQSIDAGQAPISYPVSGFKTLPVPFPVRAKIGIGALEGDKGYVGDGYNLFAPGGVVGALSNSSNPVDNFFNSSISIPTLTTPFSESVTTRNPASTNTLGFDLDILNVNNPGNTIIPNDATSATISLLTIGDSYSPFLQTFSVEIIEPIIVLTKQLENSSSIIISNNAVLGLNEQLNYIIGFQNIGNDNGRFFTIKDILPLNVTFDPTIAGSLSLPPGVTYTYNATTRTIIFTIPNNLVEINDPRQTIRIRVTTVASCDLFIIDGCSNIVKNRAFATYRGQINTAIVTDDPSINYFSNCIIDNSETTNFLVDISACQFVKNEVLCGPTLVLTGPPGFNTYTWTNAAGAIIGNSQNQTVYAVGTYKVVAAVTSGCLPVEVRVNVTQFNSSLVNPVIPFADQVVTCLSNGEQLPYIFLCGAADCQTITTGIADAVSFSWERLNTASCAATPFANCANENPACTWVQQPAGNTPNFSVCTAGEYRVVINFQGGCQRIFYFNVYQNLLSPTAIIRDIVCSTAGRITINNVPSGYEYALSAAGPWQTSNVFNTNTLTNAPFIAGCYTVFIRIINGPTGSCVFQLPNLCIASLTFVGSHILTQPLCRNDQGQITLNATGVGPQFTYTVRQGTILVGSSGPNSNQSHTFTNLNSGNYTVQIITSDGCVYTANVTLVNPPALSVTAGITMPLTTCASGELTMYPAGGTGPYNFFVNNVASTNPYVVTNPGTYNIRIVDNNNCIATTTITVTRIPAPVYTVAVTPVLCYGAATGQINFNVTNANGNTLAFSIDNGATYSASSSFPNLLAGNYQLIVRYTIGGVSCFTTMVVRAVTQPFAKLEATGGISDLAGCGTGGTGRVRITNPQGGVPFAGPNPYLFSFNNGATYSGVNEANVSPGTYTLYVKDANGCTYPMVVTLNPPPTDPTILLDTNPIYSCNGSATTTVTIDSNGGNFQYEYLMDDFLNTNVPPNIFPNVICGPHVIKINYTNTNIPTFSNLLNETFGSGGYTTSPGINPAYCFENQSAIGFSTCNPDLFINDGEYAVTSVVNPKFGSWLIARDHTNPISDPVGRFLCVNIGGTAGVGGILYSKIINDILPNQPVLVSLWAENLIRATSTNLGDPNLTIQLVSNLGLPSEVIIATQNTGFIPKSEQWQNYLVNLNPGNNTTLSFVVRSNSTVSNGNDVIVDDINVYQIPRACITTRTFPLSLLCSQEFAVQVTNTNLTCGGVNNGAITINAQNYDLPYGFDYRINGGAWVNSQTASASTPATLGAGTYTVDVRYDNAVPTCDFSFVQTITAPTILSGTASLTAPATCLMGATITATATGGTPAYQYQLINSVTNAIVRPLQNSNVFNNIPTGTYVVGIVDLNGCPFITNSAIAVVTAAIPTATIAATSDFCYDGLNQATLIVTASGGTPNYQYAISPSFSYGTSNSFTVTPGNYIIRIRDSFGCVFTLPSQTIAPQLTISATFKDLDCTATPSAAISGIVSGGYAPYAYQVSFNAGTYGASTAITATTFTYNTLISGTYRFRITDNRGCTVQSATYTVNPIVNPVATTTKTDIICGGNNGSFNVNASLGLAPYTYQFNGSGPFTGTTAYSGLAAGTYTYIVRDSKSCLFNGTVTINPASTLSGTLVPTVVYNCSGAATLQIQGATGGIAPYTYSIGGAFQTGTTFVGITNGTYTATIRDANNCTFTTNTVIIAPLNPPTNLSFTNTALTCPALASSVTLTTTGTNTPFEYQIIAPVASSTGYQTSTIFSGLAAGTYTFQVKDSKNCTYFENYTIAPIVPIGVVGQLISNVRCKGTATGVARFTVSGFSSNYNYQINALPLVTNQTAGVINLSNQLAGTYVIIVTDNTTSCTATATVTITDPTVALSLTTTVVPKTCIVNGRVTLNAIGGWGGNLYTLTPPSGPIVGPQPNNIFNNLSAVGTYTVSVTDSNNCSVATTFNITNPVPFTANIIGSDLCYDAVNGASIIVTTSGAQSPIQYTLGTNAPQSSNTFANLVPGTYNIKVTDAYGCVVNLTSVVINSQVALSTTFDDLDCNGPATIIGAVSGGYAPFRYQVSYNAGAFGTSTTITGTTFTYTALLGAGNYIIRVTDNQGCTVESPIRSVSPIVPPTATTSVIDVICNGENTGVVTINPTAGQAPFQVNFNALGNSSGFTYSGLVAGTYLFILTDAKGCIFNGSATVNNTNAPITYTFTKQDIVVPSGNCGGATSDNGEICITNISGGVGPYTIIMTDQTGTNATQTITGATGSPVGQNQCFLNLGLGYMDITIVDANNCTENLPTILISYPPGGLTIDTSVGQATCAGGGSITLTVGGTLVGTTFYYAIYTPSAGPQGFVTFADNPSIYNLGTGASPYTFTGLDPGTFYTFVIFSADNQCYYFRTATTAVAPLSNLTSSIPNVSNVSCIGNSDASVSFTYSNYNATSVTYDIREFFGNSATGITATQTGLTGAIVTVSNLGPLAPGRYYIRFLINDGTNAGCVTASAPFDITQSVLPLTLVTSVIKNDNCNPNAGVVSGTATGGSGSYFYQIFTQADAANPAIVPPYAPVSSPPTAAYIAYAAFLNSFTSATNTFNQESGNYVIFVKDANGCIQSAPLTLGLDATPTVTVPLFVSNQCDVAASSFTFTAIGSGGIGPLTYSIDGIDFQASNIFTVAVPTGVTVYQVTVKDANGCTFTTPASVSLTVYPPLNVTGAITSQPTCATNDGIITLSTTGGTGAYVYSIAPVAGTLVGNVFSNLPANTYVISVTNTLTGCTDSTPAITLNMPTPVTFTTTITDIICNAGSNGTITVNLPASNNNPVYTFSITAGPVTRPSQLTNLFTGLPAGIYTVSVTSGLNCTTIDNNVIITEPPALTASAIATPFVCTPSNVSGISTVTITGSGGTSTAPGYSYSIDDVNYFATNIFVITNINVSQIITVYVKDVNGCKASNTVTIDRLPIITLAPVSQVEAITCNNAGEVIRIVPTGGSGNYTYQTLPLPSAINTIAPTNEFTLTAAGTYYFQVNDIATGCTFTTAAYTVNPFNNINAVASAGPVIPCFGDTTTLSVNITGYAGSYTYEVFNGVTSLGAPVAGNTTTNPLVINSLPSGNYTVRIIETAAPFCQIITNSISLTAPVLPLSVAITTNINAKCSQGAQVTAQGLGGIPAYTYAYVIANAPAPAIGAYTTNATAILNPATSANWDVYVRDANGCVGARTTFTISADPTPTVTAPLFASNQCDLTASNYTFTATGTGGILPLSYSIDGINFQASNIFTVAIPTLATVYQVTVKDANGCTFTTPAIASVTVYPPLNAVGTITAQPTCAANDGIITVMATGGTGAYVYSISPVAGTLVGNVFSNLPVNTYVISVTNPLTGCTDSTQAIILNTPTPVTLNAATVVDVTCNGGADGQITVNLQTPTTVVNNNPIYLYSIINGPLLFANQTSNIFSNLPAGNYTIRVTSERGCILDQDVAVGQPNPLLISSVAVNQFGCTPGTNANNFATITVAAANISGGSGVYTIFEFIKAGIVLQTGSSNTFTVFDLAGGNNYSVKVFDDKGCYAIIPVPIINPYIGLLNGNVTVLNPITCAEGETIRVNTTNTLGAVLSTLSYNVVGITPNTYNQTNTNGTFTGLPIGNYNIKITNTATNCSIDIVHFVNNPNIYNLLVSDIVPVSCFGGNNGSATIRIVNNTISPPPDAGAFSYTIKDVNGLTIRSGNNPIGSLLVSNLPMGIYTAELTLTSGSLCSATINFTIVQPVLDLFIDAIETANVTCLDNAGVISITAGGGTAPYVINVKNITTSVNYGDVTNGLAAGNYTISVTDSNNCIKTTNVTLAVPTPINATIAASQSAVLCNGDATADISVTLVSGGQGSNYTYTLNTITSTGIQRDGPTSSTIFYDYGAGTYSITVQDAYNCTQDFGPITITEPSVIVPIVSLNTAPTCTSTGILTLSASGGTPPYTYSSDAVNYNTTPFATSINITTAGSGSYSYLIKDSVGCISQVSNTFILSDVTPISIATQTRRNISCFGNTDAEIHVTAQGGFNTNYTYVLSATLGGSALQTNTTGDFFGLSAQSYYVRITTIGGCTFDSPEIIFIEPLEFIVAIVASPVKCNGDRNGTLTITTQNGIGTIQYAISPNLNQFFNVTSNPFTINNLAPGFYDIVVTDQANCPYSSPISGSGRLEVQEPTLLQSSLKAVLSQAPCASDNLGSFSIDILGGTPGYQVSIDSGAYINANNLAGTDTHVFTGLEGGSHSVSVRDANLCILSAYPVLLDPSVDLNPDFTLKYPCQTATSTILNELTVTVDPSVVLANVTYSLDGAAYQASNIFVNLAPGNHIVRVLHTNGCMKPTATITVIYIDPLTLTLTDGSLNQIIAIASGGIAPYKYEFNGTDTGTDNTFIYNQTQAYQVTVTDKEGCFKTVAKTFNFIDIFIPNFFTPDGDGNNDGWAPANTYNYRNLEFYVFDRYGRKVGTFREGEFWDGRYQGTELPSGDYWYIIKLDGANSDREFVGNFTLYR